MNELEKIKRIKLIRSFEKYIDDLNNERYIEISLPKNSKSLYWFFSLMVKTPLNLIRLYYGLFGSLYP